MYYSSPTKPHTARPKGSSALVRLHSARPSAFSGRMPFAPLVSSAFQEQRGQVDSAQMHRVIEDMRAVGLARYELEYEYFVNKASCNTY